MKLFNNKTVKLLSLSLLSLFIFATCADLVVENENSPKTEDVLSSPADIEALIPTGFVQWWQGTTGVYSLGVLVGQDVLTSSYGNFDMRNAGEQPRIPYNNSPTAPADAVEVTERPWYSMYSAILQSSEVINALEGAEALFTEIPSKQTGVNNADYTKMVITSAKLLQGLSLAFIGQYFDQGYVLDENTDPNNVELVPYADVLAAADLKFKEAADMAATLPANVTLGEGYISGFDGMLMKTDFVELANSQRARIRVLAPRSPSEVAGVNWAEVKDLSSKGLTYDFSPEGDDMFWYNYALLYANIGDWARIDQRIVHLLDPSQPAGYPSTGSLGEATSDDSRLTTDFEFFATSPFPPSRGSWYHSHYNSARYPDHDIFTTALGPMGHTLKAENDLMYAEAVIRTDDVANKLEAVNRINETRVGRGDLAPVTIATSKADLLKAIQYERNIELILSSEITTAMGDARRYNTFQPGSVANYPVPASELLILLKDLYTFGGAKASANNPYLAPPVKLDKTLLKSYR